MGGAKRKSGLGIALSQSITKLDLVVFFTDPVSDDMEYHSSKSYILVIDTPVP